MTYVNGDGSGVGPEHVEPEQAPFPPLSVEIRAARSDRSFTDRYLTDVLWPGIDDPDDSPGLFNADAEFLWKAAAIISLGRLDRHHLVAAGLYITANEQARIAWLHGVRVAKPFRGCGYGAALVHDTCIAVAAKRDIDRIALTVRCDDTGRPRAAAYKTYLREGFVPTSTFELTVSGLPVDRHFGPVGSKLISMQMEKSL